MPVDQEYRISGKPAKGEIFKSAIASIDLNQMDCLTIERSDGFEVVVCTSCKGGSLSFILTRPDGSTWNSYETMDVDTTTNRMSLFLELNETWDQGLNWEISGFSKKEELSRLLLLIMVGLGVLVVAWLALCKGQN